MTETHNSFKAMLTLMVSSILGGCAIGLAGTAYLSCDNHYIGALLFCFGLYTILIFGWKLYTGAAGYADSLRSIFVTLPAIAVGNFIGTQLIALLAATANPALIDTAQSIVAAKLDKSILQISVASLLCGMIMFIAVDSWRSKKSAFGIFLGVPLFILCGFEHSIADMFYAGLAHPLRIGLDEVRFLIIAILGNYIGAQLISIAKQLVTRK